MFSSTVFLATNKKAVFREKLKLMQSSSKAMIKLIRCPSCGEEIELNDLYEGMEIQCKLCNSIMIIKEGRLLLLDTNEEFDIDELVHDEEEEEVVEEEEFEEDYYFEEEV